MMPKNWARYLEQLREVDDQLYNQKEQFKMGLLKPTPRAKKEVEIEKTEAEIEKKDGKVEKEDEEIIEKAEEEEEISSEME